MEFQRGNVIEEHDLIDTQEVNGTFVKFIPDNEIFKKFNFRANYLEQMFWNYCYLNRGLTKGNFKINFIKKKEKLWIDSGLKRKSNGRINFLYILQI